MLTLPHKPKLTLKDSYKAINRQLWQQKQHNQNQERENTKLKTHISRFAKQKDQEESCVLTELKLKYQKLCGKSKQQEQWIRETKASIEERQYERLKGKVKKMQVVLHKTSIKAKRAEVSLMKSHRAIAQYDQESPADLKEEIKALQAQNQQINETLSERSHMLHQSEEVNRKLNAQIRELLSIKNALRGEGRQ